jgi:signal peptidase II
VPRSEWYLRLALCLQLAGAVGNLIDRIYQGFVTDFISLGTFAVFNVADASISTGVAVMLVGLWFKERQAKNEAAAASEQTADGLVEQAQPKEDNLD